MSATPKHPAVDIDAALEAARAELLRQAEHDYGLFFRTEDGMIDGRVDLRSVIEAAFSAAAVSAAGRDELDRLQRRIEELEEKCETAEANLQGALRDCDR